MRPLTRREIDAVAGGEYSEVQIQTGGYTLQINPLANSTVDVVFQGPGISYTWNSGVAASCAMIGLGTGLMSLAFTGGNGVAASFIGRAAALGCSAFISYQSQNPPSNTDDGDGG